MGVSLRVVTSNVTPVVQNSNADQLGKRAIVDFSPETHLHILWNFILIPDQQVFFFRTASDYVSFTSHFRSGTT